MHAAERRLYQAIYLLAGLAFLPIFFLLGVKVYQGYTAADLTSTSLQNISELEQIEPDQPGPFYSHGIYSRNLFEAAYKKIPAVEKVQTRSIITAHHLLVADKIAELFEQVDDTEIETVILISPNHFALGVSPAQTSKGTWTTPYGEVLTSDQDVQTLADTVEIIKIEEAAFEQDHGIAAVTPFIARSLPETKMVPLIVDESLAPEDAEQIGRALANLYPNALLIGSIDISHELPLAVQQYHDTVTRAAIAASEEEVDLEIDSNAALDIIFAYNETLGAQTWHETHYGSSIAMGILDESDYVDNVSHILGYFTPGQPKPAQSASLHFVGDIMLDRGVRLRIDQAGTVNYPWSEMDRFLSGSHLRIGNLEGTVNELSSTYTYDPPFRFVFSPESCIEMSQYIDVVSLANNHSSDVGSAGQLETMERLDNIGIGYFGSYSEPIPRYDTEINNLAFTFIGYNAFRPNEEKLMQQIAAADAEGRIVIVMPHWGVEYTHYPTSSQRRLAELMVEAGADLIIGGHPHVVQGIEVIDDVPVVYSLGNFIFDQVIPSTWPALTTGVVFTPENIELHLLPILTKDSKPVSLTGQDADAVLHTIANASPDNLTDSILSGILSNVYEK